MSHIGKTPLKLPANCNLEFFLLRDTEEAPISWDSAVTSYSIEVPSIPSRQKAFLVLETYSGSSSVNIPEGFRLEVYPKSGLSGSHDSRRLKTSGGAAAYISLSVIQHKGGTRKGPQRRQYKKAAELWGTTQRSLQVCLNSCTESQTLNIFLKGLGYKAFLIKETCLQLKLGFSHSVELAIPGDIKVDVSPEASTSDGQKITLTSLNKQALGNFGSTIRSFRPPEPYKGKGVLWQTPRAEGKLSLRRKAGKEGN